MTYTNEEMRDLLDVLYSTRDHLISICWHLTMERNAMREELAKYKTANVDDVVIKQ
jgi:hypothetical protein